MKRLAFTTLPLLALFACDPGIHVNAHVVAADKCGAAQAQPVEGATVTLKCEGGEKVIGQTDREGRFSYRTLGTMTSDCTVHVSADGYLPRQYRTADACGTGLVAGHCPFLNLEPVLVRSQASAAR